MRTDDQAFVLLNERCVQGLGGCDNAAIGWVPVLERQLRAPGRDIERGGRLADRRFGERIGDPGRTIAVFKLKAVVAHQDQGSPRG